MANETEATGINMFGDFTAGANVPDGKYTIKDARIVDHTYFSGAKTTALQLTLTPENGGDDLQQIYSIGDPAQYQPSPDGARVVPVGTSRGLPSGSNYAFFLNELVNAGLNKMDPHLADNDVRVFAGSKGQIVNIPQPKRPGLTKASALDGVQQDEKETRTIPVFKTFTPGWEIKRPTAGATKPATTQAKTNGAPAAPAAPEAINQDDPQETAAQLLKKFVPADGIAVEKVRTLALQALKGTDPGFRNSVLNQLRKDTIGDTALIAEVQFDATAGRLSV